MKEILQEIDDDDRTINFLWHSLIATRKFIRADEVYDTINQQVRGNSNSATYLTDLEDLARTYVATFSHDSDLWSDHSQTTRNAVAVYNQFDPKPVRPLILAIAAKLPEKEVEASVQHLVSLTVRSVIASQTRSGTVHSSSTVRVVTN